MAFPSWTQAVDNMFTTTWAKRRKSAVQQAYLKTPFIHWLKSKGKVNTSQSGFRRIEVPVEYGDNETIRWISKGDTVPMTDSELVTMVYEEWKYVAANVIRWFEDEQKNRGKAAMINYTKLKLGAAERGLYEDLERVVFSDGTGAKEPNGLQNLIDTSPTTGTVHGLDRASYTWWRNQTKTATGAASLYLVSDMRNCLNNVVKYSRAEVKNIVMVTDQTTFELYEEEGYEQRQFNDNVLFDAGFDSLTYRRRPIMWCPSAPSGEMRFINTEFMELVVDEMFWMDMTEWKSIPNQVGDRVAQIVCVMNLICTRPIVNIVLSGIAA